jgi:hypothetical protein
MKGIPYPEDALVAEVTYIKNRKPRKKSRRRGARKRSRSDSEDAPMRGSADTECLQHHGNSAPRVKTSPYPMQSENLAESVNGCPCLHSSHREQKQSWQLETHDPPHSDLVKTERKMLPDYLLNSSVGSQFRKCICAPRTCSAR